MGRPKAEKTNKPELTAKQKAFQDALKTINSNFKNLQSPINLLSSMSEVDVKKISTGSLILDNILGGGVPEGRIIEIYGPESSGKTSIALTMVANVQKEGGNAIFFDVEQAFDPVYARILGVDTKSLAFSQSTIAEETLALVNKAIESGNVDIIVVDSVASLVPLAEYKEETFEKTSVGLLSRLMSKALRQISANANKHNCIVVFLNQIRDNIGEMYGPKTNTPGGRALKFFASQRIEVKRKEKVLADGKVIGNRILLKCVKNKVAPPYGEGITVLTYKKGINKPGELYELAKELGTMQVDKRTHYCENAENLDISGYNSVIVDDGRIKIATSEAGALKEIRQNKALYEHLAMLTVETLNKKNGLSEIEDEDNNNENDEDILESDFENENEENIDDLEPNFEDNEEDDEQTE